MRYTTGLVALASGGALMVAAEARAFDIEPYLSASGGVSFLQDSSNDGAFVGDFATGDGIAVPPGTVLPDGTPVGWLTEFDAGFAVAGAAGVRFMDNVRGEFEVAYQSNDVDTHTNVVAGGIPLGGADAGVLITGSPALGVTVADLVADGQGSVETVFLMANAYYDLGDDSWFIRPYIGGGLGIGIVDVDYSPSAVTIIDDDQTAFAYQIMAGLSAEVLPNLDLFGGYRFRGTTDVETDVSLFGATLDIENQAHILEAGVRFTFN